MLRNANAEKKIGTRGCSDAPRVARNVRGGVRGGPDRSSLSEVTSCGLRGRAPTGPGPLRSPPSGRARDARGEGRPSTDPRSRQDADDARKAPPAGRACDGTKPTACVFAVDTHMRQGTPRECVQEYLRTRRPAPGGTGCFVSLSREYVCVYVCAGCMLGCMWVRSALQSPITGVESRLACAL